MTRPLSGSMEEAQAVECGNMERFSRSTTFNHWLYVSLYVGTIASGAEAIFRMAQSNSVDAKSVLLMTLSLASSIIAQKADTNIDIATTAYDEALGSYNTFYHNETAPEPAAAS